MPIVDVKGVGEVEFPDEWSNDKIVNAITTQVIPQYQQHLAKTGFISSVKAGAREALAGTEEALGFDKAAEEQRKKIAETHEETSAQDIAAAKERGLLPTAGAYLEKYIGEPLGGMLGRFGAPIAAGLAAPAIAPEAAIGALGTAGVAAAGTALTDFLPEMGENIKAQKDAGKDPNYVTAALIGGVQASVAALGVPGTGAINKVLGPRLVEEAKVLAPKIVEGEISLDAAKEALTGKWTQYAQNMAVNTATNTGLMVGTEELRRAQAGQDLMSGREIAETAGQAALLSPIFGAMHLGGPRAEAETILQAGKVKYDKIQDQLRSLRDLAQTRELSRQENLKVAELQQQAQDLQLELQRVTEANQANTAANKAYEAQQADYRRPLKEQLEIPTLAQAEIENKALQEGRESSQMDLFKPNDTSLTSDRTWRELGLKRQNRYIKNGQLNGLDLTDPNHVNKIRTSLEKILENPQLNPDVHKNIVAFLEKLPETGELNVNGQSELKLEGNRDGVPSTDIGGSKPTEGAAQTNTGAMESSGTPPGEPLGGEGEKPATLDLLKQQIKALQDENDSLVNTARSLSRPEDIDKLQAVHDRITAIAKEEAKLKRKYDFTEIRQLSNLPEKVVTPEPTLEQIQQQQEAKQLAAQKPAVPTREQRIIDAATKGMSAKDIASGFEMRPDDVNAILTKAGVIKPEEIKSVATKTLSPEAETKLKEQQSEADRLARIKAATQKIQPKKEAIALTDDEKFARQLAAEELAATRSKHKTDAETIRQRKAEEKEAKRIAQEADEGFDVDEPTDDSLPNRFNIAEGEAATIKVTEGAKTYGEAMNKFNDYFGPHISKPLQEVIKRLLNTPSLRNVRFKMEKQVKFRGEDVAGLFTPARSLNGTGTIRVSLNNTNEEGVHTLLHEGVHAATAYEIHNHIYNADSTTPFEKISLGNAKTETGRRLIKLFNRAYERSFKEGLPSGIDSKDIHPKMYAFTNMHEFIAEAFSNKEFQKFLAAQDGIEPITGRKSLWQDFIQAVKDVLGFGNIDNSLLADIVNASHPLFKGKVAETRVEARSNPLKKQPEPNERLNELYKRSGGGEAAEDKGPFHSALNDIKEVNKDKVGFMQKVLDKAETKFFSSDAAFNNKIIRNMEKDGLSWDTMKKVMYQISTSQALHREAIAHQFIEHGGLEYNTEEHKYVVTDNPHSWKKMVGALDEAAKLNGIPLAEMQKYAGQALIARRYGTVDGEFGNGIVANNKKVEDHTRDLNVRNKQSDATEYYKANHKFVHLSEEQIDSGLKLFKELKGMDKVVEQWNKTRENTMKVMVDSGLYNEMDAKILLDAIEYVPFYRVEQLDNRAGPKEFSRGIVDLARDRKFRGSEKEINNVFDNMERWVSYAIRKSVGNRAATDLVQAALTHMPDEVREVPKVGTGKRENTTGVWVDGEVKHYEFDDPLFVHAFTGMEPIVIPALSTFAKFTNMLRKNIVLNPLFSIGQLSQDGFNAMITSGVKHPFAIPVEVFKEFVKTLRGTSAAHEELTARGATGTKDWSSAVSRIDAEIESNLKEASLFQSKIVRPAEKLSMASDNAVRQAIYNRTLLETGGKKVGNRIEGGDKALAIERAFEVINFRRSGSSSSVNFLRQTVPFFGAYLQALNVTGKVLLGRGIAPAQKAEARKVLASTMAKVAIAGLIYNMMVSDDDGYKKLDPSVRDRRLVIPGTDGLSLPLRSDLFTYLTKIVPEHVYQMNLDQGAEDGTKAAKALKMGLINSIASPNVMPQAIKPIFEVSLNKDFYTGRDIVGQGIAERNTQDQYTPNTSELAKVLGSTGAMSPMKIDYLLKAYFGYTAGLGLMAVDKVIAASEDKSPPEKSFRDFIASVPGASAFVSHEFGNKDITDFYELRDMVNTTVNSYNFRKSYGTPEETKEYREENKQLLQVQTQVNNINRNLTNIRHQETAILQKPDSIMSPEVKGIKIRELRLRQQKMLANIDDLRKRAGL